MKKNNPYVLFFIYPCQFYYIIYFTYMCNVQLLSIVIDNYPAACRLNITHHITFIVHV